MFLNWIKKKVTNLHRLRKIQKAIVPPVQVPLPVHQVAVRVQALAPAPALALAQAHQVQVPLNIFPD